MIAVVPTPERRAGVGIDDDCGHDVIVGPEPPARPEGEREALLDAVATIEELCNIGLVEPYLHIVAVVVFS